uniref:Scavenger receptor class F member 2 n=1 Tax=Magallana gigas TaxID=29159 RepID=A0A8W8JTV3_MAGGI
MNCIRCLFEFSVAGILVAFAYDDLSFQKIATQSKPFVGTAGTNQLYEASNAVDGNTATCMRTIVIGTGLSTPDKTVWWKVDLGGVYNIYRINILFKNYDGYEDRQRGRFAGFSLYVSDTDVSFDAGCKNDRFYGSNCDTPCPTNCKDDTCYIESGACLTCKPGWTGIHCNTKCREGWYGINCDQPCVGHCRDNATCNHVIGQCDRGCAARWTGKLCDKVDNQTATFKLREITYLITAISVIEIIMTAIGIFVIKQRWAIFRNQRYEEIKKNATYLYSSQLSSSGNVNCESIELRDLSNDHAIQEDGDRTYIDIIEHESDKQSQHTAPVNDNIL